MRISRRVPPITARVPTSDAYRKERAMNIPDSVRELIATGPHAHLTTLNPDGSPQVTVIWVGIENEEFVIGHMGVWQKVKNMRRDPRVVLSMLGKGKIPWGCRNISSSMVTPGSQKEGLP